MLTSTAQDFLFFSFLSFLFFSFLFFSFLFFSFLFFLTSTAQDTQVLYTTWLYSALGFVKQQQRDTSMHGCQAAALLNPKTSILTQKRHPYTGNLNLETIGDSERVSTLWRWTIQMLQA